MSERAGFDYDVFIEYSHRDQEWVRNVLLPRLEESGLRVLIDFRDFRKDTPILDALERAVQTSRKTLLVVTPNFIESEWADLTSKMAQMLDPAGRRGRVVVLLREQAVLPLRLSNLGYIDFRGSGNLDTAWTELLTVLEAPSLQKVPDEVKLAEDLTGQAKSIPPEFADKMRRRRPGYDRIFELTQQYRNLPPDKRAQMTEQDVASGFVEPMFQALGWTVWTAPVVVGGGIPPFDLELEYRDIRIPVEVRKFDDPLGSYTGKGTAPWEILSNFETIVIWDHRDPNQPTIFLETSPRFYIADGKEDHDLLAAEIFYERLVQPTPRPTPSEEPPSPRPLEWTGIKDLIDKVEKGIWTPTDALAEARRLSDPMQQAEALAGIGPYLPESLLLEALAIAREIKDAETRAQTLEGLASHLSNELREQVLEEAQVAREAEQATPAEPESLEPIEIATRALTDKPGEDDQLGFVDYAKALADFIQHEKTGKPLTIGVDATWGMGKTTLMCLLHKQLVGHLENTPCKHEQSKERQLEQSFLTTLRNDWIALRDCRKKKKQREQRQRMQVSPRQPLLKLWRDCWDEALLRRQTFPTVWFNAWKYDQEESLWAALALEILSQVRRQSNIWQRAKFWWELNRRRFDRDAFLHAILKPLAYFIAVFLLGVVIFVIVLPWLGPTFSASTQVMWGYAKAVGGIGGFLTAVYAAGREASRRLAGPFSLKIAEYVRKPNYEERIGFLGQFETDFKRVIEAATEKGKWPLVVFVDDLDRCAPPKPVEIIEALNLLLDAEHCVFVIGMDAQTVAASVEAKYEDLKPYLDDVDDPGGLTLGQRFLGKIIQINFRIPKADPTMVKSFIDKTLGVSEMGPSSERRQERVSEAKLSAKESEQQKVVEAEQAIKAELRIGRSPDEAVEIVREGRPDLGGEVEAAAKEVESKSFDKSPEVQQAAHKAAGYLDNNPRQIKRFINIFRLQALIAKQRELLGKGEIRLGLLADAVIIGMRWPNMIEAITADRRFLKRLQEAYKLREDLRQAQSGKLKKSKTKLTSDEASLNALLVDQDIKQFIDAEDFIRLLGGMTDSEIESLPDHLNLARTTVEKPGRASSSV